MEAIVYTFLLVGTLGIIFFAIFCREYAFGLLHVVINIFWFEVMLLVSVTYIVTEIMIHIVYAIV
jgi:hypothetical protein